jgi:hypothetical protein
VRLRLISAAESDRWGQWIAPIPHDFHHTAAYHRFSEEWGEGEGWLAVWGSVERYLAWPYLLRPIEQAPGLRDVTSVYGYAGPLLYGSPNGYFLALAQRELAALWRAQGAVSVFTRFHPLLENHRWAPSDTVRAEGETVSLDLADPDAWRGYQGSLRNRINRARRLGLVTSPDREWVHLEDFARFYHAAMVRNRAAPQYFFSLDYFRGLRQALGGNLFLMVTRQGDTIAAAAIVSEYGGIVQNHFSMNNPECLALAPTKTLLDDVRRWAAARGNRVLHLGGGRGSAPDSLFAFKAAFSDRRHRFYTGRWVLDRRAYEELAAGRAEGAWFPVYRSDHVERPALAAVV